MTAVGKYELVEPLGRGGMGEVWKAREAGLDRLVALKLLQRTSPEDLARFRREAHAVAQLSHPGIAQLYEFSVDPPYLAMQFVDGISIERVERIPQRIDALAQTARAVEAAHAKGILHRDLKPSNILVDGSGRAFVLDFGLAREIQEDRTEMTRTGDLLGTPSFMAPEQARGDVRALDVRTDVYGLGATLYALLTGRPPHTGPTPYEIVRRVIEEEPLRPRGDRDLETICLKALEKDASRRYATAGDFAADLERWRRREPILARPPSFAHRLRKRIERQPVLWGLSATLAVAIAVGAAFGGWQLSRAMREQRTRIEAQEDALAQAQRRGALLTAQRLVEEARARIADVNAAMYIDGCTLEPYFGVLEEVRARCRDALEISPEFAPARCVIGKSYAVEGRFAEAVAELERAAELDPRAGYIRLELARSLVSLGFLRAVEAPNPNAQRREVLDYARRAQEQVEAASEGLSDLDAVLARAYVLYGGGPGDELVRLVEEGVETFGRRPGVEELIFLAALTKAPASQLPELDAALEIRPGYWTALLQRAGAHLARGDTAGAVADSTRADELNPREVFALLNRASSLRAAGRNDEAGRDVEEAIRRRPDSPMARFFRAIVLADRGDHDAAVRDYDEAIRLGWATADVWYCRGNSRLAQGRFDEAAEDYTEAIRIDPNHAQAHNNRAHARRGMGDIMGAIEDCRRALDLQPPDSPYRAYSEGLLRELEALRAAQGPDF